MLKPLTVQQFGKDNLVEYFQNSGKKPGVMEQTFDEIFGNIQKASDEINSFNNQNEPARDDFGDGDQDNRNENNSAYDNDDEISPNNYANTQNQTDTLSDRPVDSNTHQTETENDDYNQAVVEHEVRQDDTAADSEEPVNDVKAIENEREPENPRAQLAQAAHDILQKLQDLVKNDPEGLKKLVDGLEEKTFGGLLKALGLSEEKVAQIGKLIDLDTKLPMKAISAIQEGKPGAMISMLKNLGFNENNMDKALEAIEQRMANVSQTELKVSELSDKSAPEQGEQQTDKNLLAHGKTKTNAKANKAKAKSGQEKVNPAIAKEGITPNNAIKTSAEANNKAGVKISSNVVKSDAGPQTAKAANTNIEVNGFNNNTGKTESTQHVAKPQGANRSGLERMLMTQIVEKVRVNIRSNGDSNMTIRLDPPDLGKLDIRVISHNKMIQAVMTVENREVKAIVENNLENLKSSLQNSGLKVDEIIVTTADEGYQFKNANLAQQQGHGNRHVHGGDNSENSMGEGHEMESDTVNIRKATHEGVLNVVA